MSIREEKYFTDLTQIAENQEVISDKGEMSKWRKMSYRVGRHRGQMLIAAESIIPDKVSFQINLKGWYHIYLCFIRMRTENSTYVKLSDDLCYTGIQAARIGNPRNWCTTEYVEEIYWKSAELTNQKIIMAKPDSCVPSVSGLVWIRCVPMTEEEIEKYKFPKEKKRCVQMHIDVDWYYQDTFETDDDYLIKLYALRDSNVDFCSMEISFDYDRKKNDASIPLLNYDKKVMDRDYTFDKKKDMLYKKYVKFARENNIKLYAANRMEVGNFTLPISRPTWNKNFVDENPQYYCKNRDGSVVAVCSYAYDEVQEYVISNLCKMLEFGFDGVSLFYHRGIHIGFEEPVIKRFQEKYPNIDPYILPVDDARLHNIWCDFMNEFMQKLRHRIDKKMQHPTKINVIVDYSLKTSKNLGLDVEHWVRNGLVDSVSQADMETYEDLSGCMSDENPQVIDMMKYQEQLLERPIIRRRFATDVEKVCRHIPEYQNLSETYGVEVYHVLPWVHSVGYMQYDAIVEQMKKAGAKKFLSWNTNHLVWDLPEWYVVSNIGNERDHTITLSKYHRVMELDGSDISHFNPNWLG